MKSRIIFEILKPFRVQILVLSILAILIGGTDGAIPFLIKFFFDSVIQSDKSELVVFSLSFLALGLLRGILNFFYIKLAASLGNQVIFEVRSKLFNLILNLNPSKVLELGGSKLSSTVINDTIFLKELVVNHIPEFLRESLRLVALIFSSFWLSWRISLSIILVAPLIVFLVQKISKTSKNLANTAQVELGKLTSIVINALLGFKTLKSFKLESALQESFKKFSELNRLFSTRADLTKNISVPINEVLAALIVTFILFFGVSQIQSGVVTQGEFFGVLATLGFIYGPIKKLSKTKTHISATLGALERVQTIFLQREPALPGTVRSLDNFDIELKEVSFSYNSKTIFDRFSLRIPFGSKVAVIGPSGIGKSTLADLIISYNKPHHGIIKIGGIPLDQIDNEYLREIITYVPQSPVFFENLGMLNFGYSCNETELQRIFTELGCFHIFERLQNNHVGEFAFDISGGEKQRLFIANALCRNSQIYIFDEITSALDVETEKKVIDFIFEKLKMKTIIFISHRSTVLKYSDIIIDIEKYVSFDRVN